MAIIDLTLLSTVLGVPGGALVASALVVATPWAGHSPAARVLGPEVTLPDSVRVQLTDGTPDEPLELAPSDGTWCWRITITSDDPEFTLTEYYSVSAVATIDFGDLVRVDPNSLNMAARPDPAWWTELLKRPIVVRLTQEAYDALTEQQKLDPGYLYLVPAT